MPEDHRPLPASAKPRVEDFGVFVEEATPEQVQNEITVDRKTGRLRQAGADTEGAWILSLQPAAERSLFVFAKAVLGRSYLSERLHAPICTWLLDFSETRRKGLLLPREHAKTSLVAHALPMHILIQPREANVYFPGESGADQRILLATETEGRGKDALRVQRDAWARNPILRALWPHRCWPNPAKDATKWNDTEYIIPREAEWPDPSVRVIGVGGASTGMHPSVMVKDDLITIEAANSPVVMQDAITWHTASRAMMNKPSCLEFIIGTRWAVFDLYAHIQQTDPTVSWLIRSVIEDGEPIYPEGGFTRKKIDELRRDKSGLFLLLYMNSAADPTLVDFDARQLREFAIEGDHLVFHEDGRDVDLLRRTTAPTPPQKTAPEVDHSVRGLRLRDVDARIARRNEHLRLRIT